MKKSLLLLVPILLLACNQNLKLPPKAKKGVLDLSSWNFEKDGIVPLKGDWEFYWKQLLKPGDFKNVPCARISQNARKPHPPTPSPEADRVP